MTTGPATSPFALPGDAVHVWYVFTDHPIHPEILDRYTRMMSAEERTRRERFVFERDRHRFLVTRGLVRTVVSRYARIAPQECVFVENQYGKPSLEQSGSSRLEFNVSHTNGLIALAVALSREVGIDVEEVTRDHFNLDVRRFFSAAEISALDALPAEEQTARFFDYWTLKEAYIKARGHGLSLPLDTFSMRLVASGPPAIEFASGMEDEPSTWQFSQFNPSGRHRMAVAIRRRGADLAVRLRKFDPHEEIA